MAISHRNFFLSRSAYYEAILQRPLITWDMAEHRKSFEGRRILLTGAAGSIGSEFCRYVLKASPELLLVLDNAETPLHHLSAKLKKQFPLAKTVALLMDLKNKNTVESLLKTYRPHMVIHAAAYKHLPLLEQQPLEALHNNVLCSSDLMALSAQYQVEQFIYISTDKAVSPTSALGVSKRLAEMYAEYLSEYSDMQMRVLRFGNVLGSQGSVLPILEQQIEQGGPLVLTHPAMKRFFITPQEACYLICCAANKRFYTNTVKAKHRAVLILDVAQPMTILELAEQVLFVRNLSIHKDRRVIFSGIRMGEKLCEALYEPQEQPLASFWPYVLALQAPALDGVAFAEHYQQLQSLLQRSSDLDGIQKHIMTMVPSYQPNAAWQLFPTASSLGQNNNLGASLMSEAAFFRQTTKRNRL